jgi:hypothetical protein
MSCSSSVFGTVRLILSFFIICKKNIRLYCFSFFKVQNHSSEKCDDGFAAIVFNI